MCNLAAAGLESIATFVSCAHVVFLRTDQTSRLKESVLSIVLLVRTEDEDEDAEHCSCLRRLWDNREPAGVMAPRCAR